MEARKEMFKRRYLVLFMDISALSVPSRFPPVIRFFPLHLLTNAKQGSGTYVLIYSF